MLPTDAYLDQHVRKNNDYITYRYMLKPHGRMKSYQENKIDRKNIKWLIYLQIVSRMREDTGTKREITKDLTDFEKIISQSKDHLRLNL